MKFDELQPDLRNWFRAMIGRSTPRAEMLRALLAAGYQKRIAEEAVNAACRAIAPPSLAAGSTAAVNMVGVSATEAAANPAAGSAAHAANQSAASGQPAALAAGDDGHSFSAMLATTPNAFATSDREVAMMFALASPRVILFANLLAPEECDELIELSRGKLERSSVVNAATGQYDVHPHRTSSGTHFARGENPLIRTIERRISELVQCPEERGEPLQILHYTPGGEYRPHFDYFDPAQPGNEQVLAQGGQRIATLIMYLNNVEAGGSTVFPQVGLDVLPRKGCGVYFAYTTPAGEVDARSLHGGSPVAAGEKWIATKWFRQRPYGGPGA